MILGPIKQKSVLIVDDDSAVRRLLSVYFKSCGFATLEADTGIKAIEISKKEIPALILMDLDMPELNGLDACEIIKHEEKTKKIPVILLTGSSKISDIDGAYRKGAADYVIKPIVWDRFKTKIARFVKL
ncbi:MAG: response regulator [Elusimicrobia bacterium]|nr:response regulator [Elusimicrobiota bacterium]